MDGTVIAGHWAEGEGTRFEFHLSGFLPESYLQVCPSVLLMMPSPRIPLLGQDHWWSRAPQNAPAAQEGWSEGLVPCNSKFSIESFSSRNPSLSQIRVLPLATLGNQLGDATPHRFRHEWFSVPIAFHFSKCISVFSPYQLVRAWRGINEYLMGNNQYHPKWQLDLSVQLSSPPIPNTPPFIVSHRPYDAHSPSLTKHAGTQSSVCIFRQN